MTSSSARAILSEDQLETLAERGERRSAQVGDVLFRVGDQSYPLIAILEGEAAVQDPSGREIIRHGAGGFLGELNLLSGQTVYLTAVVTQPMEYIAVEREAVRELLFEHGALADVLLSTFMARREVLQQQDIGPEIAGPPAAPDTRRLVDYLKRARIPHSVREATALEGHGDGDLPVVRLPGGAELTNPTNGELSRALNIGLTLTEREEVDLVVVGGGPAGLGAAVYGASEGLSTLVVESASLGGQAGTSRRIENYLGFPAGISGSELTTRAVTQARKFGSRTATPYRATALEPGSDRHVLRLEDGQQVVARSVVLATGADYRKPPVDRLEDFEGSSIFYAAGPPEARLCGAARVGVIGGGNSAAQAAIWLARGGALVTLMHRRGNLGETMSDYLIKELDRFGVAVRDRSEVAELHGAAGVLEGVTLVDGARLAFSFLFLFIGAAPCTDWLPDAVARDDKGFVLTGSDAGAEGLLETSVPGVFAAGDVRSGSVKRCATAVGEGAMAVRFVHEHLSRVPA